MFDIGFWELTIIAIVALIVIGPDKLPGVARTAGKWVGRTRRFVSQVKNDIDKEIQQDELRKMLEKESGLNEIKDTLNSDQYRFDEEKEYLLNAVDDTQLEPPSATETAENTTPPEDDSASAHPDDDETVKHERT